MWTADDAALEEQIGQWRGFLRRRQAIVATDIVELEDHLRERVAELREGGLAPDEAFLVAVKRMGAVDEISREFAREHSERLWKQLVVSQGDSVAADRESRREAMVALSLAVFAAVLVKIPTLFGLTLDGAERFYLHNAPFFVLPLLAGFFAWKRKLDSRTIGMIALGFVVAIVTANVQPVVDGGYTQVLMVLHLPIALWLLVGLAYAGVRWRDTSGRMDFIRFSGELFIYFVLIALGGGVLMAFLTMIFQSIGIDTEYFIGNWLVPCGAAGAVLVASWLVEAKQSVIENMAPVLTRLFTPLFAALLITFLGTLVVTGRGLDIERDILIAFDLLLVVVLALMLYTLSARDPMAAPGGFDVLSVVLVVSALLVDLVALAAIGSRISEFGFTPNRVAALGLNLILLVNLSWSAVLYLSFLRGRAEFAQLERWQTGYLPVYSTWAAFVVLAFPPLFGFI
jgi:hypothetical protein